ncbi:hypothetical protein B0H14DRAFT_2645543 [Mycena olivaceomarginata]|nr:hypothetical protein B0H14DRAFT_2645543 [Mycena olivaceomarginata]
MSAPARTIYDRIPFVLFSTSTDSVLTLSPTPGRPLLTVYPAERGLSTTQTSAQSWPLFSFLVHPMIYRLFPLSGSPHVSLVQILGIWLPSSITPSPYSLVSAVAQALPERVQTGWTPFLPPDEPATSPTWDTYPSVHVGWLFPRTEEFPEDQPLRDSCVSMTIPPSCALLAQACASLLRFLTGVVFSGRLLSSNFAIPRCPHEDLSSEPYPVMDMADYDSMWHWWQRLQEHQRSSKDQPLPLLEVRTQGPIPRYMPTTPPSPSPIPDPVLLCADWTFRSQSLRSSTGKGLSVPQKASAVALLPLDTNDMPVETAELPPAEAQHPQKLLIPLALPWSSSFCTRGKKTPRQGAPPAQPTPITNLDKQGRPMIIAHLSQKSITLPAKEAYNEEGKEEKEEERKGARSSNEASTHEFQCSQEQSKSKKADLPEYVTPRPVPTMDTVRLASESLAKEQSEPTVFNTDAPTASSAIADTSMGQGAPPAQPTPIANLDKQGRPMIIARSSQKSITPPAEDAYNEEGEEEKGGGRGGGAGSSNKASTHEFQRCQEQRPAARARRADLPEYVPPRPVPTMDTVRLASESLAKEQSESTVFNTGCAHCILCDRGCEHGTPGTRPFGNELITDLSAARTDSELAREQLFRAGACLAVASNRVGAWIRGMISLLGPDGLPGMAELPEELQPIWAQLLLDSETELSNDYRATILRYPFISDPR